MKSKHLHKKFSLLVNQLFVAKMRGNETEAEVIKERLTTLQGRINGRDDDRKTFDQARKIYRRACR